MFRADREELAGKRALVTGGTQGVGAAIVSRLGAAGAKVATAARSERPSTRRVGSVRSRRREHA